MKNLMNTIKSFIKSEKGDFGVKEIAITIAIIIIIGAATTFISGSFLNTSVQQIWNLALEKIGEFIG